MVSQGSIYNCKNHPNLRWFDTKPGGVLVFMGELVEAADGAVGKLVELPFGIKVLKEAAYEPGSPMVRLRRYLSNQNPYAPELPLNEPFTFEQLKDYMRFVFKMEELGYVFECECPASDLERLPDETYDTVSSHRQKDLRPCGSQVLRDQR